LQDDLAVVATGRALAGAGLAGVDLGERAGLYLAVGYIPFESSEIEALYQGSVGPEGFSMAMFSTTGIRAVKPLITFRCLPNMPAFHIATNFDVQGPYFGTYPGAGQLYLALEEACAALCDGTIDLAIVGGVAHQRNFLVAHHFGRIAEPIGEGDLADAAACLVLETASRAEARKARARARLAGYSVAYHPHDPFEAPPGFEERFDPGPFFGLQAHLGPASLPAALALTAGSGPGRLCHRLHSRDGVVAQSAWELS
jgi:3-oxoacyl-(acyl-carrier-protein) synthase